MRVLSDGHDLRRFGVDLGVCVIRGVGHEFGGIKVFGVEFETIYVRIFW